MLYIITNIFIYAFAILGFIIFVQEVERVIKLRRLKTQMIFIIEDTDETTEYALRYISKIAKRIALNGEVYVVLSCSKESGKVIEEFLRQNEFVNIIEKNEFISLIKE